MIVTGNWQGYAIPAKRGYDHLPVTERADPPVAEE
jgi:hypothetical protein